MLASLILALPLPVFLPHEQQSSFLFPYLLVVVAFLVGLPVVRHSTIRRRPRYSPPSNAP